MFRSPISPASFCTSALSSSRNVTSSGDSGSVFEIFLPGILTPNHQSSAKTAATAIRTHSALKSIRLNTWGTLQTNLITGNALARLPGSARCQCIPRSRDLFAELQRAENEQQVRHQNEN